MAQLFIPPLRRQWNRMRGSLGYYSETSLTVWKDGSGWHAQETPDGDTLLAATQHLGGVGSPVVVSDATAAELVAAGIGTCIPITP